MTRFSCGYCMHTFEAEEMPRECPNCEKYGPLYYVFTLSDEDFDFENGVLVTFMFDVTLTADGGWGQGSAPYDDKNIDYVA